MIAGGAAAGDYDRDGWVDLYVVRGDVGPNLLFRNLGDVSFEELAAAAGVAGGPAKGAGPIFADIDGDGWLDLIVGGVAGSPPAVFRNLAGAGFEDVSLGAGLTHGVDQFSAALADFDRDGDLDLALAHWRSLLRLTLWENDGSGAFSDVSVQLGVGEITTVAFTPNFADLNDDGWPDLVVAGDFGTSIVLINDPNGGFNRALDPAITDENGMGAAVIDYDHDGDLDWFVASISDPNNPPLGPSFWGVSGSRLYRNLGGGVFEDATDEAGVRHGSWGWASCFADFDNDGHPDLFHVNGFPEVTIDGEVFGTQFTADPARLFIAQGDGRFLERASELGIADTGQGRGVVCFDYDRDGDVDVFIANNSQAPALYRNDGGNARNFLSVTLSGVPPNTSAAGARVFLTAGGVEQMREVQLGNHFASSDPTTVHFGLGDLLIADELRVEWPTGETTVLLGVEAGQFLTIAAEAQQSVPTLGVLAPVAAALLIALSSRARAWPR